MKLVVPGAALAIAGGAALIAFPSMLRAADESPHDAVERLMLQLMSEDDTTRADAERRLFELGDAGRAEVERMTRESDPRRAITALRLLQSGKWPKAATKSGERRVHRGTAEVQDDDDPFAGIQSLRAQMDEMRKRFEQFDRGFNVPWPDIDIRAGGAHGRSSGKVVENDKSTTWSTDEEGRLKITIQDGKDAPRQTFEAKDLDELRKQHPEIAKRVEPLLGESSHGRSFTFRLGPQSRGLFRGGARDEERDGGGLLPGLEAPQAPVLGIEWAPVPDVLREQVDCGSSGIVVESVVKGSLAEKLGLVRYDVLLEVAGRPVSGSPDVREALKDAKDGDKVTAVVVRKGQKKTLETTK